MLYLTPARDICARLWAAENPTKNKNDFDTAYKTLPAAAKKVSEGRRCPGLPMPILMHCMTPFRR